jgi:hypothetical protein
MARKAKEETPNRPEPSGKNAKDEYATFETALKQILKVPRKEMQKRLKDASASRVSNA